MLEFGSLESPSRVVLAEGDYEYMERNEERATFFLHFSPWMFLLHDEVVVSFFFSW